MSAYHDLRDSTTYGQCRAMVTRRTARLGDRGTPGSLHGQTCPGRCGPRSWGREDVRIGRVPPGRFCKTLRENRFYRDDSDDDDRVRHGRCCRPGGVRTKTVTAAHVVRTPHARYCFYYIISFLFSRIIFRPASCTRARADTTTSCR